MIMIRLSRDLTSSLGDYHEYILPGPRDLVLHS